MGLYYTEYMLLYNKQINSVLFSFICLEPLMMDCNKEQKYWQQWIHSAYNLHIYKYIPNERAGGDSDEEKLPETLKRTWKGTHPFLGDNQ